MNGPTPAIQVDDSGLKRVVAKLLQAAADATPAFAEIGEILRSSVTQNFLDEGRYSSPKDWRGGTKKWEELKPPTIAHRLKSGRGAHPILQVSGQLKSSISVQADANGAQIGTNLVYAGIHQFGGKAGRGKKVTIPARPFLVVQDQDLDDAIDVIARHLAGPV